MLYTSGKVSSTGAKYGGMKDNMKPYPADVHPVAEGKEENRYIERIETDSYTITEEIHDDQTWSYSQDTVLFVRGQSEPFQHTDRNTLHRIAAPTPNPTALQAMAKTNEVS